MSDGPRLTRPANISKRDLIIGLLTASLVDAQVPGALSITAKACEALTGDYEPNLRRWYPIIGPQHARAAILYAGRVYKDGSLTKEEYDWVCTKARMAILHAVESPSSPSFTFVDNDRGPPDAA